MSGQWPPEWEDSDTGLPDAWTVDDAGLDPEASAVASFLASVPTPVLPAAFEARISAAIAAEATARANGTAQAGTDSAGTDSTVNGSAGTSPAATGATDAGVTDAGAANAGMATAGRDDAKTTDRSSRPEFSPAAAESSSATAAKHRRRRTSSASRSAARQSRPAGSRPGGRRPRFRMPSAAVTGSLLILLVIAGFALVISQSGSSSSSSGVAASGAAGSASVAAPAASSFGEHSSQAGRYGGSVPQSETNLKGGSGRFVVTESGIKYQGSTLASQVREQLNAVSPSAGTPAASTPVPASSSTEIPANLAPPAQLTGCVWHLTGGVTPSLVDQASYDGTPAYIIAVPSRVWVVRLGCTAADPEEITSASLTGLYGNLSALGSVEGYASPGERRMQ